MKTKNTGPVLMTLVACVLVGACVSLPIFSFWGTKIYMAIALIECLISFLLVLRRKNGKGNVVGGVVMILCACFLALFGDMWQSAVECSVICVFIAVTIIAQGKYGLFKSRKGAIAFVSLSTIAACFIQFSNVLRWNTSYQKAASGLYNMPQDIVDHLFITFLNEIGMSVTIFSLLLCWIAVCLKVSHDNCALKCEESVCSENEYKNEVVAREKDSDEESSVIPEAEQTNSMPESVVSGEDMLDSETKLNFTQEKSDNAKMKFCRICGERLFDDSRFCHGCGTAVIGVSETPSVCKTEKRQPTKNVETDRTANDHKQKKTSGKTKKVIGVCLVMSLACCGAYFGVRYGVPYLQYEGSLRDMESGNVEKAMKTFIRLGDYKDSDRLAIESSYLWAVSLFENGDSLGALEQFNTHKNYKDSGTIIKKCKYELGKQCVEEKKYREALSFLLSADANDAEPLLAKCYYNLMLESIAQEDWEAAYINCKNSSKYDYLDTFVSEKHIYLVYTEYIKFQIRKGTEIGCNKAMGALESLIKTTGESTELTELKKLADEACLTNKHTHAISTRTETKPADSYSVLHEFLEFMNNG